MKDWDFFEWVCFLFVAGVAALILYGLLSPSCSDMGGREEKTGAYMIVGTMIIPETKCIEGSP